MNNKLTVTAIFQKHLKKQAKKNGLKWGVANYTGPFGEYEILYSPSAKEIGEENLKKLAREAFDTPLPMVINGGIKGVVNFDDSLGDTIIYASMKISDNTIIIDSYDGLKEIFGLKNAKVFSGSVVSDGQHQHGNSTKIRDLINKIEK